MLSYASEIVERFKCSRTIWHASNAVVRFKQYQTLQTPQMLRVISFAASAVIRSERFEQYRTLPTVPNASNDIKSFKRYQTLESTAYASNDIKCFKRYQARRTISYVTNDIKCFECFKRFKRYRTMQMSRIKAVTSNHASPRACLERHHAVPCMMSASGPESLGPC